MSSIFDEVASRFRQENLHSTGFIFGLSKTSPQQVFTVELRNLQYHLDLIASVIIFRHDHCSVGWDLRELATKPSYIVNIQLETRMREKALNATVL